MNNLYVYDDKSYKMGYNYAKQKLEEKNRARLNQKIAGLVLAALGAASVSLLNFDLTAALLLVPAGIALMISKKNYLF